MGRKLLRTGDLVRSVHVGGHGTCDQPLPSVFVPRMVSATGTFKFGLLLAERTITDVDGRHEKDVAWAFVFDSASMKKGWTLVKFLVRVK